MLTPLDIQNKVFKSGISGYNKVEVDEFMAALLGDYEKIYRNNMELKDKVATMTDAISHYKSLEDTMQGAILVAQSTSDEVIKNAHKSAENITAEANIKAQGMIADANAQISRLETKYMEMKNLFDGYKIKMAATLKAQLEILESIPVDSDKITRSESE